MEEQLFPRAAVEQGRPRAPLSTFAEHSFLMPTITSYFGFLLAVLTITAGLFISLNKIRLI
ncbi:cytochrome b6-F complex subunit VI PetL protein [Medicago truncatula]|uniref:Cytochrome b6-f complex subunit 6 n=69 Tax=IRL clade TaxID=2233839 RepID=G7K956_MEDTR|nr:cytochrome b6-F complex subunit VI PetL protein [Medicago truncatula]